MKAKIKSLFWKLVGTIGAWALFLSIIQGICNYYFVTIYTKSKDIAQINLIEQQTAKLIAEMKNFPRMDELQLKLLERNLDKIEREIIRLDSKSDEILKKMTITEKGKIIETMQRDTLKDLTPALKIKSSNPQYINSYQIKYSYSLENKGKYSVNVYNAKLYLSTTKIVLADNIRESEVDKNIYIRNQLLLNKDYYLRPSPIMTVGYIAPGEEVTHDLMIEFTNPKRIPSTIYYCVTFDAQTDPNIINSVKNVSRDRIYNKKFYNFSGEIFRPE